MLSGADGGVAWCVSFGGMWGSGGGVEGDGEGGGCDGERVDCCILGGRERLAGWRVEGAGSVGKVMSL